MKADLGSEYDSLNLLLADFYSAILNGIENGVRTRRGIRLEWNEVNAQFGSRIHIHVSSKKFVEREDVKLGLAMAPGMIEVCDYGVVQGRHSMTACYSGVTPREDGIGFMERAVGSLAP